METAVTHTILIIDDNPDDVEIAKRILARMDRKVDVEAASRGEGRLLGSLLDGLLPKSSR